MEPRNIDKPTQLDPAFHIDEAEDIRREFYFLFRKKKSKLPWGNRESLTQFQACNCSATTGCGGRNKDLTTHSEGVGCAVDP